MTRRAENVFLVLGILGFLPILLVLLWANQRLTDHDPYAFMVFCFLLPTMLTSTVASFVAVFVHSRHIGWKRAVKFLLFHVVAGTAGGALTCLTLLSLAFSSYRIPIPWIPLLGEWNIILISMIGFLIAFWCSYFPIARKIRAGKQKTEGG